jgi:hypothetical protein
MGRMRDIRNSTPSLSKVTFSRGGKYSLFYPQMNTMFRERKPIGKIKTPCHENQRDSCNPFRKASIHASIHRSKINKTNIVTSRPILYFLRNEHPSVSRALPPVGWQSTCEQPAHWTTVWACEKTVVIVKQPGHFTSMKKERGPGTRVLSLCLRASAAGVGLRRSTARTC